MCLAHLKELKADWHKKRLKSTTEKIKHFKLWYYFYTNLD